jgi:hypothetical protein
MRSTAELVTRPRVVSKSSPAVMKFSLSASIADLRDSWYSSSVDTEGRFPDEGDRGKLNGRALASDYAPGHSTLWLVLE